MSLIQRITALAQTLGREIKSLWAEVRKREGVLPPWARITIQPKQGGINGWSKLHGDRWTNEIVGVLHYGFNGRAFMTHSLKFTLFPFSDSDKTNNRANSGILHADVREYHWECYWSARMAEPITESTAIAPMTNNGVTLIDKAAKITMVHTYWHAGRFRQAFYHHHNPTNKGYPQSGGVTGLLAYVNQWEMVVTKGGNGHPFKVYLVTLSNQNLQSPAFKYVEYRITGANPAHSLGGSHWPCVYFDNKLFVVGDTIPIGAGNPYNKSRWWLFNFDHANKTVHISEKHINYAFPKKADLFFITANRLVVPTHTPNLAYIVDTTSFTVSGNVFNCGLRAEVFDEPELWNSVRVLDNRFLSFGADTRKGASPNFNTVRQHEIYNSFYKTP